MVDGTWANGDDFEVLAAYELAFDQGLATLLGGPAATGSYGLSLVPPVADADGHGLATAALGMRLHLPASPLPR